MRDAKREIRDWRAEAVELRFEVGVLRGLVLSMALGLPRESMPASERLVLDEILGRPS